ncbi:hypothetical protein [Spirosoma pollinicola]|uniref:Uncharacterized protein n=1 Tax=Spirosoma pollinicola TaxID=2057025 RepID=A0A2K8Z0B7_9BACT|nr:hypothetical protein [Spirosoma pollinicola]AUD03336.1 hypothetical protein CWM47_16740 [Spirosoma pollinicola]
MTRPYSLFIFVVVSCLAVTCARDYPSTTPHAPAVVNPPAGGLPGQQQPAAQRRLFLGNDKLRVGIDLNMGGAITYLAEAGSSENMVNNPDLGRQIQTSIYAGPINYEQNNKKPPAQWPYLGWNPVQAGDYYLYPAQIVSYQQTDNLIYVKTIPHIWPLLNEPAECTFEHWITIKDNTVHVRCRVAVSRADTTQYDARTQETPCVYLNGPYDRMITYTGLKPFTNDAISEFTERQVTNRYASENWAALLNAKGRGVGLYKPGQVRFRTGAFGIPHVGSEFDVSAGYINSEEFLLVDHNGEYEFEYTLIVGSLPDIRQYVYNQPRPPLSPNYTFSNDRLGWFYINTTDRGWPIQNELNVQWARNNKKDVSFRIASPLHFWYASNVPKIQVEAAFQTKGTVARLSWRKPDEVDFMETEGRYVDFPITGDGQFRTYEINTSQLSGWDGVISQISLTSPPSQYSYENGSRVRVRSVTTKN